MRSNRSEVNTIREIKEGQKERRQGYQPRYSVSPWKVLKVGAVIVGLLGLGAWAIEHIARHM